MWLVDQILHAHLFNHRSQRGQAAKLVKATVVATDPALTHAVVELIQRHECYLLIKSFVMTSIYQTLGREVKYQLMPIISDQERCDQH